MGASVRFRPKADSVSVRQVSVEQIGWVRMRCNGIRLGEALLELWPKDDDQRREWCVSQGVILESHCCLGMAYAISRPLLTPHQGPNRIVDWIASWSEYRIPVPYDGYASTILRFCPWCGSSLPRSRKEEWYQTVYELGFTDPGEQDIPAAFNSDSWWRNGG